VKAGRLTNAEIDKLAAVRLVAQAHEANNLRVALAKRDKTILDNLRLFTEAHKAIHVALREANILWASSHQDARERRIAADDTETTD